MRESNASYGCYPLPLLNGSVVVQQPVNLAALTGRYTAASKAFIAAATTAKKNWALYFAFDHVHTPQFGGESFGSQRGPFGNALLETDAAVGAVLDTVGALQDPSSSSSNTGTGTDTSEGGGIFALLTSDNGAPSGGSMIAGLNAPFSGTKFQTWEGGVRMPAVAWWPGQIPAHGATSAMASSLDVFATVVELAGLDLDAVLCHKVKFTGLTQNWKLTQNFD